MQETLTNWIKFSRGPTGCSGLEHLLYEEMLRDLELFSLKEI